MRLKGKTAIIVGAGQTHGETMGNGRATALRFAEEGASLLLVDKNEDSALETSLLIKEAGGTASVIQADITQENRCKALAKTCVDLYGKIDILHNNVGRSEGDQSTFDLNVSTWDRLMDMNLKGMFMTIKHVLPFMRDQLCGSIINVSSTASISTCATVTYKTSKGAINTMTQHVAMENAAYGIRANAILPGLMDTPMAIERRAREQGIERDLVRKARNIKVPLRASMGTALDVANAALFLASDEAQYITGVLLPVDGGRLVRIGE
ncbi:MAG: 3-oxoacyl-ACP reductase [Rhodospirillaceae bacterium TMED8]|nr:3-oxoacyl-ACP reductase [Magnetovibrio sp.]OUT50880.1 MAG: 3-oxoacyl-ACP reductase [Rhodospirillaceae bacterium TMED8]|tara:strand:+ start:63 stop:860 length:798 start_codon:yes stop_codon:yes gene_type:complete